MYFSFLIKRIFKIFAQILIVLLSIKCADSTSNVKYVTKEFSLHGKLNGDFGFSAFKDLNAYYMNENGERKIIDNFIIDTNGEFDIIIKQEYLQKQFMNTTTELFALMGEILPSISNNLFSMNTLGYLKLEFFSLDAYNKNGDYNSYFQFETEISNSLLFLENKKILLSNNSIKNINIGRAMVSVVDEQGTAIENAEVFAIPMQDNSLFINKNQILSPLQERRFIPIKVNTNKLGKATVFPIVASPLISRPMFQIVANATNFCMYISPQTFYLTNTPPDMTIKLEKCNQSEKKRQKIDWQANFASNMIVRDVKQNNLTVQRAFTNNNKINFKLTNNVEQMRSLRIRVYENEIIEGDFVQEDIFPTFASEYEYILPDTFTGGKTNGIFTLVIESIFSTKDKEIYGNPLKKILSVAMSSEIPVIKIEDYAIKSLVEVDNIISGSADTLFYFKKTTPCLDGEKIGLVLLNEYVNADSIHFFTCTNDKISIKFSELYNNTTLKKGGEKDVLFFTQNIYKNINVVDDKNSKKIYVDYGIPDISNCSLDIEFGFAPKNADKGTDTNPYNFNQEIKISQKNISNYVLRFANPAKCSTILSAEDGSKDGIANEIYKFYLNTDSTEIISKAKEGTLCNLNDLSLTTNSLTFPDSVDKNLSFALNVIDKAGNISNSKVYEIKSCQTVIDTNSGEKLCWE